MWEGLEEKGLNFRGSIKVTVKRNDVSAINPDQGLREWGGEIRTL